MSVLSKAFIAGFVAVVSTTTVSAQEMRTTSFRFDKSISTEENYSNFERTARRDCSNISDLATYGAKKECRRDLMNKAIAATKHLPMIAYHDQMTGKNRQSAAVIQP